MKMETRLMIKFLTGVFYLVLLLVLSLILIYSLAYWLQEEKKKATTPEERIKKVVSSTKINDGEIELEPHMKRQLAHQEEWTQVLDERGRGVFQYNTPKRVPRSFSASELVLYKKKAKEVGYDIHTWHRRIEGKEYTWMLGRKNTYSLLQQIKRETQGENGSISLPPDVLSEVKDRGGWIQILDQHGKEIYQYARPPSAKTSYSPGEFAHASQHRSSFRFLSGVLQDQQVTWVYHGAKKKSDEAGNNRLFFFCAVFSAVSIFVFFSYRFGKKLGEPLLFMLEWLRNLSKGMYHLPQGKKIVDSNRLNKKFALYQEVIQALEQLSSRLREVEEKRKQLDQSREEWLAGVTHDLKTPLSTMRGYADLYRSPGYKWGKQEIEEYLQLIVRKTEYIHQLIDDMSLTFQVKNHALSLQLAACDMKEMIRLATAEVIGEVERPQIQLELPAETTVMYPIDAKWFKRAFVNLLMNAWIHNPPHTEIVIKLEVQKGEYRYPSLIIEIADDGKGMDEKTLASLFDRYYRGTDTNRSSGGTGLGMAIAKHLIQLHQGTISVSSKLHHGTTFTIWLPARNE